MFLLQCTCKSICLNGHSSHFIMKGLVVHCVLFESNVKKLYLYISQIYKKKHAAQQYSYLLLQHHLLVILFIYFFAYLCHST